MTAPSYTTDLQDWIADSDTTAWGELVNAASGGAPDEADTESALQGTNSCSQSCNTTSLVSMCRILASPVTLNSGDVFLVWHGHGVATALLGYSSGGLRLAVANTLTDWKAWAVGGNDVPPFPYSKWVNNPIDPTISYEYSNGTPPSSLTLYGVGSMAIQSASILKGQPHIVDMIRYGRAEARIAYGESGNYATFSGFAAKNDANNGTDGYNRWGLIQAVSGGYQWKGLMILGYTNAVDFRDSNKNIFIQDCRKVYAGFNKIEVRQSGSRVDWTNISIINVSPSTNASPGAFEMIDNADVNFESCQFTDMGAFTFLSNAEALRCQWLRCAAVTAPGIAMTASKILTSSVAADASALVWNANVDTDGKLDNMTFSKGTNAHHAINLGTSAPTTVTLRGITFSGFNASNEQNDSVIYLSDRGSDTAWTINAVGVSGTVSYKKARSGDTVSVVINPVTFYVYVKDSVTLAAVNGARVLVKAADGTGPYPYQESVSISRSGSTCTVTHSGHGMVTGDKVLIEGCTQGEYNGCWSITRVDDNSYTYTISTTPSTPAAGTPIATFVLIHATTSSGFVSDSRSWTGDQNVAGWVRYAAGEYKPGTLSSTVDSETGGVATVLLVKDT